MRHLVFILAIVFSFFLTTIPAQAVRPEEFCDLERLEQIPQAERATMSSPCSFAGQYEESALPDKNATLSGQFREGKAAVFDYKDFIGSFTRSLGKINRAEKCEPTIEGKKGRVAYPSLNLEKTAAGTIPVSVIKEEELNSLFAEISRDKKYAFDIPEDGCWARAHLIARELEKRGIRVGKMFVEGTLTVDTPNAADGKGVVWSYHVAPLVAVQTKTGVELRILDASMFNKPVPVKTWTEKMLPTKEQKNEAQVYITDRFTLTPLRGRELSEIRNDPSRDRWHVMETMMAEQELELRRMESEDRREWRKKEIKRPYAEAG